MTKDVALPRREAARAGECGQSQRGIHPHRLQFRRGRGARARGRPRWRPMRTRRRTKPWWSRTSATPAWRWPPRFMASPVRRLGGPQEGPGHQARRTIPILSKIAHPAVVITRGQPGAPRGRQVDPRRAAIKRLSRKAIFTGVLKYRDAVSQVAVMSAGMGRPLAPAPPWFRNLSHAKP